MNESVPFVIVRDVSGEVRAYLEENGIPVRMAPGDHCLARGEIPLTLETKALLDVVRMPKYKRERLSKNGLEVRPEVLLTLLADTVGAGYTAGVSQRVAEETG